MIQPSPSRLSVSRRNYLLSYIYNFAFWRRRETRTTVTTKNYMPCPWPVAVRRDDTVTDERTGHHVLSCPTVSVAACTSFHFAPCQEAASWLNSVNSTASDSPNAVTARQSSLRHETHPSTKVKDLRRRRPPHQAYRSTRKRPHRALHALVRPDD